MYYYLICYLYSIVELAATGTFQSKFLIEFGIVIYINLCPLA